MSDGFLHLQLILKVYLYFKGDLSMKIAQVSPLYESVPPKLYGGTERVVSFLTEELVRLGHDVTLFASGDSLTSAKLISPCQKALRLNSHSTDSLVYHMLQLQQVSEYLEDFDIVHYHVDFIHFPFSRRLSIPQLTTLHGRLDLPDLFPLYSEFCDMPVVSISKSQRKPLQFANWVGNVYHGLPKENFQFYPQQGNYLAFLGRISPEKRVDRAIEIAIKANMPIKVAAKIDRVDQEYFDQKIKHLMDHPLVEFIGEIGDSQKSDFLGQARALLFPIDWPEPFGLVVIESLACGTPVIAYECGSVPELLTHNENGFIVRNIDEAVESVGKLDTISRRKCRNLFEERFAAERMAKDYLGVYEKIIKERSKPNFERFYKRNSEVSEISRADLHISELPFS